MMYARGTSGEEVGEEACWGPMLLFFVVFFQMTKLKGTSPEEVALGQ